MVQNRSARLITYARKSDHITPILKELHWLPVKSRIEYKVLLLTYKCLNNMAPDYLSNMLEEYKPPRPLRSSAGNTLCVPKTRTKGYGDRAFSVSAPRLWNALPMDIRSSRTLRKFRTQLKTHLFKMAYEITWLSWGNDCTIGAWGNDCTIGAYIERALLTA